MIIHHIQNHTETGLVKGLHHLLELKDTCDRVVWIRRERAFYSIVIERFIPPVVLIVLQTSLVDCREICRRQQLDICNSYLLQMVDTGRKSIRIHCARLRKRKVFSLILNTGSGMY